MSTLATFADGIHLVTRVEAQPQIKRKVSTKPKCCHPLSRCTNQLFMIIDGQFYCYKHSELFWAEHFIEDHKVVRLDIGRKKA